MSRPAKKNRDVSKKHKVRLNSGEIAWIQANLPEYRRKWKFSIFCKGKKWKYLGPASPLFSRKLSAGFTITRFDGILKKMDNQASFRGIKKIKKTSVFIWYCWKQATSVGFTRVRCFRWDGEAVGSGSGQGGEGESCWKNKIRRSQHHNKKSKN